MNDHWHDHSEREFSNYDKEIYTNLVEKTVLTKGTTILASAKLTPTMWQAVRETVELMRGNSNTTIPKRKRERLLDEQEANKIQKGVCHRNCVS